MTRGFQTVQWNLVEGVWSPNENLSHKKWLWWTQTRQKSCHWPHEEKSTVWRGKFKAIQGILKQLYKWQMIKTKSQNHHSFVVDNFYLHLWQCRFLFLMMIFRFSCSGLGRGTSESSYKSGQRYHWSHFDTHCNAQWILNTQCDGESFDPIHAKLFTSLIFHRLVLHFKSRSSKKSISEIFLGSGIVVTSPGTTNQGLNSQKETPRRNCISGTWNSLNN